MHPIASMPNPPSPDPGTTIGVIANPVSARDIRRVVANASNLQTSDRVNILLRLLASAAACGVGQACMMPDKAGQRALLLRALQRNSGAAAQGHGSVYPRLQFLDFDPESSVHDTYRATRELAGRQVAAIVVLGGDGTHRAVVRELLRLDAAHIPLVAISTGTNNAFPEMREPSVAGMALGLYASGRLQRAQALQANKLMEVRIERADGSVEHDIAIVDAVVSSQRYVGARALWRADSIRSAFLAFAEPQCIGFSAIGGLLQPVPRQAPGGLAVHLSEGSNPARTVLAAPIAPGMVVPLAIADWHPLQADRSVELAPASGTIALDGERELAFGEADRVSLTLREHRFHTVDVARCMQHAAALGLMRWPPASGAAQASMLHPPTRRP